MSSPTSKGSANRTIIGFLVAVLATVGLTTVVSPTPAQAAVGDLFYKSCISNTTLTGCVTS
ncbi:MAG: hypothetical protein WCP28_10520 [Actinomycetes bacterium]